MRHYGFKTLLFLLTVIVAGMSAAQKQVTAKAPAQETPKTQQTAEPKAGPAPQETTENIDQRPLRGNSGSRFEPSEEVSEDLSISFPADI